MDEQYQVDRCAGEQATPERPQVGLSAAQEKTTVKPFHSDLLKRLQTREERLSSERQQIRLQVRRITETPSTMSMNDFLIIVESVSKPITID